MERENSKNINFGLDNIDIAWCPGCGNFSIRKSIIAALEELGLNPRDTVMVSGIGQAAKMPHYINVNYFNGLHGRGLPPATAIKAANPELTVIAEGGDGDMYGEGGNHLLHAIRRNPDLTLIVHNNMVYGLTKGQASPTSMLGMVTPVQVFGVFETPINPIALAISLDAPFVARAFAGDMDKTREIIKAGIKHKGFSIIDIYQPCVSFNKLNTFKWFKDHTYYLEDGYDSHNRAGAFKRALEDDPLPLGIFYVNDKKPSFEENLPIYKKDKTPLINRENKMDDIKRFINSRFKCSAGQG